MIFIVFDLKWMNIIFLLWLNINLKQKILVVIKEKYILKKALPNKIKQYENKFSGKNMNL